MTAICLIDTSVFVELIRVPGKSQRHDIAMSEFRIKIEDRESLFLPMAVIFETGNHIGQASDGRLRRECAERFVTQVRGALDGVAPFTPIRFPDQSDIRAWIEEFPDRATQEMGLGDLSIIKDWERLRQQSAARRVYIWAFDEHLSGYDSHD